ncbi:MAG: hypothetical protein RIR59_269, partial [Pseudomonadota bacterium]
MIFHVTKGSGRRAEDKCGCLFFTQRLAEQKSLAELAAKGHKLAALKFGFYPFHNDAQVERPGKGEHSLHHAPFSMLLRLDADKR